MPERAYVEHDDLTGQRIPFVSAWSAEHDSMMEDPERFITLLPVEGDNFVRMMWMPDLQGDGHPIAMRNTRRHFACCRESRCQICGLDALDNDGTALYIIVCPNEASKKAMVPGASLYSSDPPFCEDCIPDIIHNSEMSLRCSLGPIRGFVSSIDPYQPSFVYVPLDNMESRSVVSYEVASSLEIKDTYDRAE